MPIVCVCGCGCAAPSDDPETPDDERVDCGFCRCSCDGVVDIVGGMGDCTTLRKGDSESESGFGGRGRKSRTGRLRSGWCGFGGRRMFIMRWKEGRSTFGAKQEPLAIFLDKRNIVRIGSGRYHPEQPSTVPTSHLSKVSLSLSLFRCGQNQPL